MRNPWLSRRIVNFAHQGGALEAPSSTMFAIAQALENGATAIELDVHASRDGVLVVSHDPDVDRTTNSSGTIASLSIEELSGLDNAYYFVAGKDASRNEDEGSYLYRGRAPADRRFGIATLAEVLEAYPSVLLNLDIKQSSPEVPAYEEALARLLQAHGRSDDVIVASFNDQVTRRFSAFASEIGTAPGTNELTGLILGIRAGETPKAQLASHVAVQMPARYAGVFLVDEKTVEEVHRLGLALHVWTVDEQNEMETLVGLGVDGVITNRPSVLSAVLSERGATFGRSPQ